VEVGEKRIFEPKKSKFQGTSEGCGVALRRPEIFSNGSVHPIHHQGFGGGAFWCYIGPQKITWLKNGERNG